MTASNNPQVDPLNDDLAAVTDASRKRVGGVTGLNPYRFSFWLAAMLILWVWVVLQMANDSDYLNAFNQIKNGIPLTISLAFSSYVVALVIGLLTGILRASPPTPLRTDRTAWIDWLYGAGSSLVLVALAAVIIWGVLQAPDLWRIFIGLGIAGVVALLFMVDNHPLSPIMNAPLVRSIRRNASNFAHLVIYELVSFYIEFMRGIPPIVFLLIAGFIIVPAIREPITDTLGVFWIPFHNRFLIPVLNLLFHYDFSIAVPLAPQINFDLSVSLVDAPEQMPYLSALYNDIVQGIFHEYTPIDEIIWRGRDPATAIAGLSLIYGAFLSEVFRAGIQSVAKGQVEASKSLGMSTLQTMRYIVIPQAVRNVLPPLGNNFISMIKDTSLVTILGTSEITQEARRWSGSQFTYLETYAVLSVIYLTMTVTGSLLVQIMERRLRQFDKR